MKLFEGVSLVFLGFLLNKVESTHPNRFNQCGALLGHKLVKAEFSATSGIPGIPVLPAGNPWIPDKLNLDQTLTVDLGQVVQINSFEFAGDPTKNVSASQISLYYSNDNKTFTCIKSGERCQRFWSSEIPPVNGSVVSKEKLGTPIMAQFIRFHPLEPDPERHDGGVSLRVQLHGCLLDCGALLDGPLLSITSDSFSATSGDPGLPLLKKDPWIPKTKNLEQTLTVDLGKVVQINSFEFAGDPTKAVSASQISLYYSNDGKTFTCIKSGERCQRFWSSEIPPVEGSVKSKETLGTPIKAQFIRFHPLEPDPAYHDGGASLRVELYGCLPAVPAVSAVRRGI